MIVADVQALLLAAKNFAEAAEISAAAKTKLATICEALEPFRSMDVSAYTALVRQAEEYRTTGVLPVPAKTTSRSSRKPKLTAEDSARHVEQLVKQLRELYAVVHEETVGFGAIDELCDVIGKLSKPQILQVATGFGIKVLSKTTKPQALQEIKRKLTEQKGSAQRIQPIAGS